MTKKDFFRTVVKLFGLYAAVTAVFYVVPRNFVFFIPEFGWKAILYVFATSAIPVLIFVYLIFKADLVVDMLRLDKGFDDDLVVFGNLTPHQLIEFSSILIGGVLVIDNLIYFSIACIDAFSSLVSVNYPISAEDHSMGVTEMFNWLYSGLSLIMGYLLITNASWIAEKLSREPARPMNADTLDG